MSHGGGGADIDPATIVSEWIRFDDPGVVVTGQGFSSVPLMLGGGAAVQTTDARRPFVATSGNGLTIARFLPSAGVGQLLSVPLNPARTDPTLAQCICGWIKPATVAAGSKAIWTSSSAGVNLYWQQSSSTITMRQFNDASNGRSGVSAAGTLVANVWAFAAVIFDGAQTAGTTPEQDALRARLSLNTAQVPLTFSANPTQTAVGSTLRQLGGNGFLGAINTSGGSPFDGWIGPDWFFMTSIPTLAQITNLMNFRIPTD